MTRGEKLRGQGSCKVERVLCPTCNGKAVDDSSYYDVFEERTIRRLFPCRTCKGDGVVVLETVTTMYRNGNAQMTHEAELLNAAEKL